MPRLIVCPEIFSNICFGRKLIQYILCNCNFDSRKWEYIYLLNWFGIKTNHRMNYWTNFWPNYWMSLT